MYQGTQRVSRAALPHLRLARAIGGMVLAVIVAGCTRSTGSNIAPTSTLDEDATFQAFTSASETAAALAAAGGGVGLTATPVIALAPAIEATATPLPPTPIPATATAAGPRSYTVKPGDWLFKIAREQGVSPQTLIAANPGINPNFLRPGQVLTIPGPGGLPPAPSSPTTYVVRPGDWIFQIARKLGKDPNAIIAANPGVNPSFIQPGQVLNIP